MSIDFQKALRIARAIAEGDVNLDPRARASVTSIFLGGLSVGVILGLVFAPQSGQETRDFLAEKAKSGLDQATSKGKDLGRRAQEAINRGKDQVSQAVETGKQAYYEKKGAAV